MWYNVDIIVTQNKNFYDQTTFNVDKDSNEYHFTGNLGNWFITYEYKTPSVNDTRKIFDREFRAYRCHKRGWFKKEIWWVPIRDQDNTQGNIYEFAKLNLGKLTFTELKG